MGINNVSAKFLFYSKTQGVSFENTLMIGRQISLINKKDILKFIDCFNHSEKSLDSLEIECHQYAEPLFHYLGAKTVDSMDCSNFEGATIIHDLNQPIPEKYYNTFSAIVDGGTSEHIFNFPNVIKSCMQALKVGGHYVGMIPANNWFGHGFYQFSPDLYFRVFDKINGFKIKLVAVHSPNSFNWYKVADPETVQARVTLTNTHPLSLMVLAEKTAECEIFSVMPQQSDYVVAWNKSEMSSNQKKNFLVSIYYSLTSIYRKLPEFIRMPFYSLRYSIKTAAHSWRHSIKGVGHVQNSKFFEKIEI